MTNTLSASKRVLEALLPTYTHARAAWSEVDDEIRDSLAAEEVYGVDFECEVSFKVSDSGLVVEVHIIPRDDAFYREFVWRVLDDAAGSGLTEDSTAAELFFSPAGLAYRRVVFDAFEQIVTSHLRFTAAWLLREFDADTVFVRDAVVWDLDDYFEVVEREVEFRVVVDFRALTLDSLCVFDFLAE